MDFQIVKKANNYIFINYIFFIKNIISYKIKYSKSKNLKI